jgi:hypothetical protein
MFKVKAGLESAIDSDGAAILDAATGVISTLNPVGACVWNGLCEGTPLEDIIGKLSKDTGESISVIEPDVRRFVEQLRMEGLLQD